MRKKKKVVVSSFQHEITAVQPKIQLLILSLLDTLTFYWVERSSKKEEKESQNFCNGGKLRHI